MPRQRTTLRSLRWRVGRYWRSLPGSGWCCCCISGRVGYFNDELYFLVAGHHLDWGYADQGPLTPLLARAMDIVFPGSLVGERLPATVLTTVGVVVAALIARELGGRRRAQVLTAGKYAMATVAGGHLLMTATVDVFFWAVTTWLLVRWVRLRHDRLLLRLGAVLVVLATLPNLLWQALHG